MIDAYPKYIIRKIIFDYTFYGKTGMKKDIIYIPVIVSKDMDDILKFINEHSSREYHEDEFEPTTKEELLAYAKTCNQCWKG